MVPVAQVAEFVDDDVVEHGSREPSKVFQMKIEIAPRAT